MSEKILIIRFSSFGDIVQTLACVPGLARRGQVEFLTKKNFAALPRLNPKISKVHAFEKEQGLWGLIKLAFKLRKQNFSLVYDAHENPRSKVVRFIVSSFKSTRVVVRPKQRLRRFLFFKLKMRQMLPMPFKGIVSFCRPLKLNPEHQHWDFTKLIPQDRLAWLSQFQDRIILVPSAAWEMKRWPLEHWKSLIQELDKASVILGGKEDTFCEELAAVSENSLNLAGQLSLVESCYLVSKAKIVISADTGLLHVADLLSVPVIALIGPTAFGVPTFKNAHVLETNLECRPCTKDGSGQCTQNVWRQCMVDISPQLVLQKVKKLIG